MNELERWKATGQRAWRVLREQGVGPFVGSMSTPLKLGLLTAGVASVVLLSASFNHHERVWAKPHWEARYGHGYPRHLDRTDAELNRLDLQRARLEGERARIEARLDAERARLEARRARQLAETEASLARLEVQRVALRTRADSLLAPQTMPGGLAPAMAPFAPAAPAAAAPAAAAVPAPPVAPNRPFVD